MKIHEYQAKGLMKKYGIPVEIGVAVSDLSEAASAIAKVQELSKSQAVVVKAQIHAGGRGKGGGVKYSPTTEEALENCNKIMGMTLITPQTTAEGQLVKKLFITQAIDIDKEFYLAITLDRATNSPVIIASAEGGVEIEEVAEKSPEKIFKQPIDIRFGLHGFQVANVVKALGITGASARQASRLITNLYKCYEETDASIAEINPLVLTKDGEVLALDAKFNFDDSALFRHKDIAELRDLDEEDPDEVEAAQHHLSFVNLDGNVGCMVNGAGLAMATMDIIKLKGGEPANFLDVGGSANPETVKAAFKIILRDPKVKAILINIFGGIVRCDRIANGVIDALAELDLNVPVVVRLQGTNAEEAKEILAKADVDLIAATDLDEAASKVVNAAQGN